tara:strand:+ start:1290 stop:2099 length:810 start_codon:yes stop_codon:yes gene_type:complete
MSRGKVLKAYPELGTTTLPDGETTPMEVQGTFINVYRADQPFKIVLDGVYTLRMVQNRRFQMPFDENGRQERFSRIEIVNDSGNALTYQLEIGDANIESFDVAINNDIFIRNASLPNDQLQIKTKAGTVLDVDDANTQTAIAALKTSNEGKQDALAALLQHDKNLRAPLLTLAGASFAAQRTTGTNNVVTAIANTDGIIIRRADLSVYTNGSFAEVRVGGNPLLILGGATANVCNWIENVFVPAGLALDLVLTNASTNYGGAQVWYEVL